MADEKQQDDYIEIKIPQEQEEEPAPANTRTEPKKAPAKKKVTARKAAPKPITPKNASKPPARKQPRKSSGSGNWLWLLLLIIGLVVIAAVIYLSLQQSPKEKAGEEDYAVALVNGQPIYASEFDELYQGYLKSLPYQPNQTVQEDIKESLINQLIEQKLLLQEADNQGITASQEELDAYAEDLKAFFSITQEQLENILAQQNISQDEFEENNRQQIVVTKLINQTVLSKIIITDEDIEARYENETLFYTVPEQAIVRHILVAAEPNMTDEELEQKAQDVEDMIKPDFSNFCGLVTNYSADPGSLATCGEYAVAQDGYFIPEFEQAAFSLDVNQTAIVKSDFGYHIIWKVSLEPAHVQPLEEVYDEIEGLIRQERTSLGVSKYLDGLRDQATIERYPLDGSAAAKKDAATDEVDAEDQDEELQVTVEKTKPVRQGDFGKCLSDAGAVMYGVDWAPDVEEQKGILGEAFEEIEYVDCTDVDGETPAACSEVVKYSNWPVWVINGEIFPGKQSEPSLFQKTGCAV